MCAVLTPCANSGSCTSSPGAYNCSCSGGWTGTNCTVDYDECSDTPCKNSGKCTNLPNSFSCECLDGFSGTDCSDVLPVCDRKPCKNNGSCFPASGSNVFYSCDCITGFNGTNCENNIDDCVQNNCTNGAPCKDGVASYTCECSKIHFGTLCDKGKLSSFYFVQLIVFYREVLLP